MKKKKLIIILLLIIIVAIFFIMGKNGFIENVTRIIRGEEDRQEEIGELFSYIVYDNKDEENTKVLITVNSESGIEYIQCPNGNKIDGQGKKKLGIDYGVNKEQEYKFIIKEINNEEQEKKLYIDNNIIENTAVKLNIEDIEGYTTFNCENIINFDGYNECYYKIGEKNDEWKKGTQDYMFDYDIIQKGLDNDDDTVTISAKIVNDTNGNEVIISKKIDIVEVQEDKEIQAESLIKAISGENVKTGKYKITVNSETYNAKVYNIVGNTDIIMDTSIGVEEDVGTADGYAQNMIILKVNGNLTVQEGKTLLPYGNKYGGPKGMFVYCTETLTNNGTISMTGRGAKAKGQDVYLWKNGNGNYEFVPATGITGGIGGTGGIDKKYNGQSGSTPSNASSRMTGGGGGGAGQYSEFKGGTGGTGTSYSGGTGGGGASEANAINGSDDGASGGSGVSKTTSLKVHVGAGGGAGNPGGNGSNDGIAGSNGTGGLLIIYSRIFDNESTISSNGASGGSAYRAGGGGSGGGSINIFYREKKNKGTIQVNGGAGGIATRNGESAPRRSRRKWLSYNWQYFYRNIYKR